jgi:succinyl-CoA synthetase alpha subunit
MIVTSSHQVLVQGMTGRQGSFWTGRMLQAGTTIVAGVSPRKGGQNVHGVPVYDTVAQAAANHTIDITVLFVPPLSAKTAAIEAITAGIPNLVLLTEHIPHHDTMEILAEAADKGANVIGPNTAGLVTPGQASVGIMPAFADNIFQPGNIGVISRSGSLGTLASFHITQAGYGQSAFIGIGGDPILGTTTLDALRILEADPRTKTIVLVGEIGGTMEEIAAQHIYEIGKTIIGIIAGTTAPPGRKMGHAGAIITRQQESGRSKQEALKDAGVHMINVLSEIGPSLEEIGNPNDGGA